MTLEEISKLVKWHKFPTNQKKKLFSTVGSHGPTSFHNYCDWCIGCRKYKNNKCYGNPLIYPKKIFIRCVSFKFFYNKIYKLIPENHKYILIIADDDFTIPNQCDKRVGRFYVTDKNMWEDIINNEQIIHIFCSHLDVKKTNRYSPLPVGFNPEEHLKGNIDTLLDVNVDLNILNKPLKILSCCRLREGPQWLVRKKVNNFASNNWKEFVDIKKDIEVSDFFYEIQKYSFIFCTQGGGLEPNPKVFCAIYCGVIPIIKKFVNCEILYEDLPVIFVDEWTEDCVSIEKLKLWRNQLKDYFYNEEKRKEALYKLTSEYWIKYIEKNSNIQV